MSKAIVIVGTLDTKGEEYKYLKDRIEAQGCSAFVVDAGVLGPPGFAPDVSADEVAEAGGVPRDELIRQGDRGKALDVMADGVAVIVERLHEEGRVGGIISMGGGGGTALGTRAMRRLPIEIPKVMVSTIASGDTSPYVGITNITMMPSIVDVAGLNRVSRRIFTHAADGICGMVRGQADAVDVEERPAVAASMFGNTTRAVDRARQQLVGAGYEPLVFHATGAGGKTMEMLVQDGYFDGVLDMTITELVDDLCGGVLSAGPQRLEAAARAGIPQVVAPGCLDMCNFWAMETVPEKYKERRLHYWNANVTLMRTTPDENRQLGETVASKLNESQGPVAVLIPTKGFSELDAPGQPFWWPEANAAFVEAVKGNLRSDIPVEMVEQNINDPEFADAMVRRLLQLVKEAKSSGDSTQ